jgi:hypothetical protein
MRAIPTIFLRGSSLTRAPGFSPVVDDGFGYCSFCYATNDVSVGYDWELAEGCFERARYARWLEI